MTNFDQLQSRESSENIQWKEQIDSKAKWNYEATISTNADKKFGPYWEKLLAQARAKHWLDANGTTKQDWVQAINDIWRSQQEKWDGNRGWKSQLTRNDVNASADKQTTLTDSLDSSKLDINMIKDTLADLWYPDSEISLVRKDAKAWRFYNMNINWSNVRISVGPFMEPTDVVREKIQSMEKDQLLTPDAKIWRSQKEKWDGNRGWSSYFWDTIKVEQPLPMQRHEALQLEIEWVRQKQNELVSNLVWDYLSQWFWQDIVWKLLQKSDVQQAIDSKLNWDPNELFDWTDLAWLSELLITNFDRLPAESKNMFESKVKDYLWSKLISTNFPGWEKYVDFLQKWEAKVYPWKNQKWSMAMMVEFPDNQKFYVRNGKADNLVRSRG